jgi:four helix bundle protein
MNDPIPENGVRSTEYIQFLHIAKGSCGELRTHLYLAEKLGYITSENANQLINKTRKISSMLYNLIKIRKEKF